MREKLKEPREMRDTNYIGFNETNQAVTSTWKIASYSNYVENSVLLPCNSLLLVRLLIYSGHFLRIFLSPRLTYVSLFFPLLPCSFFGSSIRLIGCSTRAWTYRGVSCQDDSLNRLRGRQLSEIMCLLGWSYHWKQRTGIFLWDRRTIVPDIDRCCWEIV